MRIRKRFPPFSLSSPPLSDPQLNGSPLVQHHLHSSIQLYPDGNLRVGEGKTDSQPSDPPNQPHPPPADQGMMIGSGNTRWVSSDERKMKQKELEVKDERWRGEEKSNDTRREGLLYGEVGTGVLPPSSSHQGDKDKVIPLKKRRGSFERRVSEETTKEKEKKMKAKMKSKTNRKCVQEDGDEEEGREMKESTSVKKSSKRGSVIMEGSRCSRVNGRGWRCCQQTLVGYSLCEHHLGKGRLRTMTSVRSRDMAANTSIAPAPQKVQPEEQEKIVLDEDEDDDDEEEEETPLMVGNKRMKLGMVKARSISSLLGITKTKSSHNEDK